MFDGNRAVSNRATTSEHNKATAPSRGVLIKSIDNDNQYKYTYASV
jgi:hypothetical protein